MRLWKSIWLESDQYNEALAAIGIAVPADLVVVLDGIPEARVDQIYETIEAVDPYGFSTQLILEK